MFGVITAWLTVVFLVIVILCMRRYYRIAIQELHEWVDRLEKEAERREEGTMVQYKGPFRSEYNYPTTKKDA